VCITPRLVEGTNVMRLSANMAAPAASPGVHVSALIQSAIVGHSGTTSSSAREAGSTLCAAKELADLGQQALHDC
jgi:hypothetical protein